MSEYLQARLPNFRVRLSETVAWCSAQTLESNPVESPEIMQRRRLAEEAAKISRRAYLSHGPSFWKSLLGRKASRLFSQARPGEIPPPLARQLRSSSLRPEPLYPGSTADRIRILETLSKKRAEQLRRDNLYPRSSESGGNSGRLLLYAPDENLCDGAAQYSSKGFFDIDNVPPWDTWICFFEPYLVSWVPPRLVELANIGIEVNPEECICWAPKTWPYE